MSGNAVTPIPVTHTLAEICNKTYHCVLKSTTSKDPKDSNCVQNYFTENLKKTIFKYAPRWLI